MTLVETRTVDTANNDPGPAQSVRYQHGNHLGSATLELDEQASVITYEEYFPYGPSSYQAVRSSTEATKRYRYTGKERDEESDLCYHGARYYAPWLGRWTGCDPVQPRNARSLYAYGAGNSLRFIDPDGMTDRDITGAALSTAQWGHDRVKIKVMADVGDVAKYSKQGASRYLDAIKRMWRITEAEHPLAGAALKYLNKTFSYRSATTIVIDRAVALAKTAGDLRLIKAVKRHGMGAAEFAERSKANFVKAAATRWAQTGGSSVSTLIEETRQIAQVTEDATKEALPSLKRVEQLASRVGQRGAASVGAMGSVVRAGGVALAGLSAYEFGKDVAAGKAPQAIEHGAGAVAGGFEAYSLATSALGIGGAATGAVGLGTAVAAAPVAAVGAAAAGGLAIGAAVGIGLERSLNVSDFSAAHGMEAEKAARSLGAGDSVAMAVGVTATILSTPIALHEAFNSKLVSWFK